MKNFYDEMHAAVAMLRLALTRFGYKPEEASIVLPMHAIRSIITGMPTDHALWQTSTNETRLRGVLMVPAEARDMEIEDLKHSVRDYQRRLARRDERDRRASIAMAQIMDAVPLADAVEAGESLQTLADYVVRRLKDG